MTDKRLANVVASMAAAARLSATVTTGADSTTVCLAGAAGTGDVGLLEELFRRVHADVQRTGVADVLLDVRELEFMSSPAFRVLLRWVGELERLEPARRYRLRILSDPAVLWQRGTLLTLGSIAADRVFIELPWLAKA